MLRMSELTTVKEVSKWWYEVKLSQTRCGMYVIIRTNPLTNKSTKVNMIDYNLASAVFDQAVYSHEGH